MSVCQPPPFQPRVQQKMIVEWVTGESPDQQHGSANQRDEVTLGHGNSKKENRCVGGGSLASDCLALKQLSAHRGSEPELPGQGLGEREVRWPGP